jgi:hypothetical protein
LGSDVNTPIPGQEKTAEEVIMQQHKPVITSPYLLGGHLQC